MYSGGGSYNPAQVLRDDSIKAKTEKIDDVLSQVGNKSYIEISVNEMKALIGHTAPDDAVAERVWDTTAIAELMGQFAKLRGQETGYVYVDRDRGVDADRRETAGILEGGEYLAVPGDKVALYMLRMKAKGTRKAAWWPQICFPDGRYAFAFSI